VLTGLCLITPDDRQRLKIIDTRVRFKRLGKEEIEAYVASREWRGKAGGYAIQGLAGCFVQKVVGSYTNVVGLPLTEVVSMLLGEASRSTSIGCGSARPTRSEAARNVQLTRRFSK
jgi:septum formation protein